ncbi:MAG TPA: DUF2723 domain-containing protein [Vicinamibacterales bacterium]|nr:DUF2723 domain-containing protein [Vicinamibacterales bacterium]
MPGGRVAAAVLVATIAFVAYTRTLLPGVDLGDTGGFQAAVTWPETTARQAYPLYYGLATPFVKTVSPGNPARGLNLFSAVFGAAAVGLLTWVIAGVSRSVAGGAAGALFLAFSYTFWSQAVIAEVYTLHLALAGACLAALQAFAARPTRSRLAIVCAIYALAFGNHLSTILLLVPFLVFVVMAHPQPRELFRPQVVAMALVIAAAGALQYTPNLLATWSSIEAPALAHDRVAAFWFDVTKSDWRATMVLGAQPAADRIGMWAWDARQQFGAAGLLLAAAGAVRLWWLSRAWAALVWLAYAINTAFAITYNVGDTHVFFLPGHFFTAFAIGAAISVPTGAPSGAEGGNRPALRWLQATAVAVALCYASFRGWETWPAADRHRDARGEQLAARMFSGLSDQTDLLVARMNWDQENALRYAGRFERRDVAWVRLLQVLPHFPRLVSDNRSLGRDIVLTADAMATVMAAYDGYFPLVRDEVPPAPTLSESIDRLPRGTPYVLSVLTPVSVHRYNPSDVEQAMRQLAGGRDITPPTMAYEVVAGLSGEAPSFRRSSDRPFHAQTTLLGDRLTIRMDAWLPTDTFRRGGFGHVLRGRDRVLFIERGASLVWFSANGTPVAAYAGGLYAPQPRFRIPVNNTHFASR